jgi:hypothetical protein
MVLKSTLSAGDCGLEGGAGAGASLGRTGEGAAGLGFGAMALVMGYLLVESRLCREDRPSVILSAARPRIQREMLPIVSELSGRAITYGSSRQF